MSNYQELEIDDKERNDSVVNQHETLNVPHLQYCDYSLFFNKFMLLNRPCIISKVSSHWPCAGHWITNDNINHEYLTRQYGKMEVCVSNCDDSQSEPALSTVEQYMQYLSGQDGRRQAGQNLYLKDWHLRRSGAGQEFYRVPLLFASDWLNEYCIDNNLDDFMFVYVGPKGSWTPLHADVYSSFSWSVNITGRKRWIILPPGEERKLVDVRGTLPSHVEPGPGLQHVQVLQEAGDAIFIPSGWHHVVYNELDTISINHNWVNGCNICITWRALQVALSKVEKELSDIKNEDSYLQDCQRVLKCDHGMNYPQFVEFIVYIGRKRLKQTIDCGFAMWGYRLGQRHLQFDLQSLLDVIIKILEDRLVLKVVHTENLAELRMLKNEIEAICASPKT